MSNSKHFWANFETLVVYRAITSDPVLYAEGEAIVNGSLDNSEAAGALQEFFEDQNPLLEMRDVWSVLLQRALHRVNWSEILVRLSEGQNANQ